MGILRQAKNPGQSKPIIIQYQHARRCISACLQAPTNLNRIVAGAVVSLEQRRDDPASSPLIRDDAIRSIEVIQTFQRTINSLEIGAARFEAGPNPSAALVISGVEVTVWSDAVALTAFRGGTTRVGQVFVRCTIGASGEGAENRRAEANGHLATIAHMHSVEYLSHLGVAHSPSSMVIDVPRATVVRGPASIARRVANIEAACSMIAAVWSTV